MEVFPPLGSIFLPRCSFHCPSKQFAKFFLEIGYRLSYRVLVEEFEEFSKQLELDTFRVSLWKRLTSGIQIHHLNFAEILSKLPPTHWTRRSTDLVRLVIDWNVREIQVKYSSNYLAEVEIIRGLLSIAILQSKYMYVSLSGETTIALAMQNTVIAITIIDDYPDNLWEREANTNTWIV